MLINLNRIRETLGEELWQAAQAVSAKGGVRETDATAEQSVCIVATDPPHRTVLSAGGRHSCTCAYFGQHGLCLHIAAAAMTAKQNGTLNRLEHTRARSAAPALLNVMESALPEESTVKLEVLLVREPREGTQCPGLRMGLRIGEKRLYVVRSLPQLLESIDRGTILSFGKGFTFHGEWMRFSPADERVLNLLRTLFSAAPQQTEELRGRDLRLVSLPEPFAEGLLSMLEETAYRFGTEEENEPGQPVR